MLENHSCEPVNKFKERADLEFLQAFRAYINEQVNLPHNIHQISDGIERFNTAPADNVDGMENTDNASVTNFIKIQFQNLSEFFTEQEIEDWGLVESQSLYIDKIYGNIHELVFSDINPLQAVGYTLVLIIGDDAVCSTKLIPASSIQNVLHSGTILFE